MSPEEVSDALIADARQEIRIRLTSIESRKEEFLSLAKEIYNQGGRVKSRPPLLRIVSVGDTSLEETKKLYAMARSTIYILTRAFEYYPQVSRELLEASERGVTIKTLMRSRESLSVEDGEKRDQIVSSILVSFKDDITIKVSDEVPIRGCIIDPEEEGSSLFLVEEQGVPFVFREAAITSHPGVVRGLMSLFDLKWRFDSDSLDYRG
jgi:sugar-specific transcriptional regulator TrmB